MKSYKYLGLITILYIAFQLISDVTAGKIISLGIFTVSATVLYFTIYNAPENLDEDAEIIPPYPSSSHYDAKTWRFVLERAKPGACIWNVA